MSRPVHALPVAERLQKAYALTGREVVVTYDGQRCAADAKVLEGELVSVARPFTGGQADVAVIRRSGYHDVAISLATVISLEEVNAT